MDRTRYTARVVVERKGSSIIPTRQDAILTSIQRLPWDYDLDTQVSDATLQYLGANHNMTIHNYTSSDGNTTREFLLDVNPWIVERVRGNGMNIIDARWIDVRNGLFIDITGLSEVHPHNQPGVWSCKNYHYYKTDELYPMRETMFEGVMAKVPYNYDKILTDEYSENALILTEFNGYVAPPYALEALTDLITDTTGTLT